MNTLHPAHRLACWLLLVVAVQFAGGLPLALLIAAVPLAGAALTRRWLRLLWRMRWLLLSLLAVLGWSVAGMPLWTSGTLPAPTVEGLTDGVTQCGRLALVLAAVALLAETTPPTVLMAGSRTLLAPLRALGLDVDRAVVRLALVLHYAETMAGRDWRELLSDSTDSGPTTVDLALPAARPLDWLATLAAVTLLSLLVSA